MRLPLIVAAWPTTSRRSRTRQLPANGNLARHALLQIPRSYRWEGAELSIASVAEGQVSGTQFSKAVVQFTNPFCTQKIN